MTTPEGAEAREPAVTSAPPPQKQFPCVKCGARLAFDPTVRALQCTYCGHAERIEPGRTDVIEHDLEEYMARQTGQAPVEGRSREVACPTCGAVTLLEDRVSADRCAYCGAHLSAAPTEAENLIPPEGILPFCVDERRALEAFDKWLESRWFAPRALKKLATLGKLTGVYVPFWTFDAMTCTFYDGQRGDNYTVEEPYTATETYTDGSGQQQTRQVTKTRRVTHTRWYPVSGEIRHYFDDIYVCASTTLPGSWIASFSGEELARVEAFQPGFLTGFVTERYGMGLRDGYVRAREIMEGEIRELVRRNIGGDQQTISRMETQHFGVTFKHVLLPVWLAVYRFHNEPYRVMVNGRTAEVVGGRPYSWAKIISLILVILALIGGLIYFFTSR